LRSGTNPLSKVRYTRHILWLALRVALTRDAKCSRHFSPGSGTIFKEPASGGFLRSGTNPLSKVRQTPPTFPNFTSVRRISPHNAVAM